MWSLVLEVVFQDLFSGSSQDRPWWMCIAMLGMLQEGMASSLGIKEDKRIYFPIQDSGTNFEQAVQVFDNGSGVWRERINREWKRLGFI